MWIVENNICCSRRTYWVVAARPVEDAAGGRRPAACMLLLACAHACASLSRDPVLLTVIQHLLPWRGGRVRQEPFSSTSFLRGLHFPVQKHLGESLHRLHSLPCGHQVQPSASCWGSPGATPGRGWFDSRLRRPTMSSVTEATRGYAWRIEPSTLITSRAS